MNTDTPRTDEWLAEEKRNPRISGLGNWLDYCKTLERELTAAREELADLKKHIDVQNKLINTLQSKKVKFKEQRDEARKLAEKYRYLSCDSQEEADATLLPWENNQPTEL